LRGINSIGCVLINGRLLESVCVAHGGSYLGWLLMAVTSLAKSICWNW
jgi:hypothetical protein